MSKLLPSVSAPGTAAEEESQRRAPKGADDTGDGPGDAGGTRWRRRAVYAAGGLAAVVAYRRLRGRSGRNADPARTAGAAGVDDEAAGADDGRSSDRRVGSRVKRLAAGFVAASVAKRLLRRWQR